MTKKKGEYIKRYGEASWRRILAGNRKWREAHPKYEKSWREAHPGKVTAHVHERSRKGGKHYEEKLLYDHMGLQGLRNRLRSFHNRRWSEYKKIIAPESQIHHEWIPGTSRCDGVALVEANQHRYGIIDVIQILDGKITLLTEEGVRAHEV